ncbi:hypothetical protein [Thermomonospora umbrina]|uniref:Phosphotransferase family enzyme n=1 Tax=Thermomonospora umbrina TaxID=111806 RepID=A0A3D9SRE8_9ACTN|nr:hypothetical protein [Thermomonospora umbrina]REE95204.1 hypothetical protein DFJ69_0587 [Thermomonospora umbrina]
MHHEDRILAHARLHGVPTPEILVGNVRLSQNGIMLGMLLEDLGDRAREAGTVEGVTAAVAAHQVPALRDLPVLDEAGLAKLPARAMTYLTVPTLERRWAGSDDVRAGLAMIRERAPQLAAGAGVQPWGLVHFHPASLHIGHRGWRLLDWAHGLNGPGLLDLASWQGTTRPPDVRAPAPAVDAPCDHGIPGLGCRTEPDLGVDGPTRVPTLCACPLLGRLDGVRLPTGGRGGRCRPPAGGCPQWASGCGGDPWRW